MILHNQQAVPRLQIHRFVHDYLRNFCIDFSCFFMIFRYRFRDWFLITFLMENCSKKHLQNRSPGRPFRPKRLQKWSTLSRVQQPGADLFSGIDFSMFSGLLPASFWARFDPFGCILASVGLMSGPLGSISGAFWALLVVFSLINPFFGRSCRFLLIKQWRNASLN